jgi:hypothetical protein
VGVTTTVIGHEPSGTGCSKYNQKENVMTRNIRQVGTLATLFALAVLCGVRAAEVDPTDEGKGTEFKGKTVEMKDKSEFAILLAFPAGKEVTATTKGEKETDVHLFVYAKDKKEVGKDITPGPTCEVKFTPAKAGKFKFLVRNLGPGANKVTLEVKVAK